MRRVYKNLCPATINASIMGVNTWKNSLKNVESDVDKMLYETLLDFYSKMVLTFCISLVVSSATICTSPRSIHRSTVKTFQRLKLQTFTNFGVQSMNVVIKLLTASTFKDMVWVPICTISLLTALGSFQQQSGKP